MQGKSDTIIGSFFLHTLLLLKWASNKKQLGVSQFTLNNGGSPTLQGVCSEVYDLPCEHSFRQDCIFSVPFYALQVHKIQND